MGFLSPRTNDFDERRRNEKWDLSLSPLTTTTTKQKERKKQRKKETRVTSSRMNTLENPCQRG
jgi:hypothetical protein